LHPTPNWQVGILIRRALDPSREQDDDEIAYQFEIDVDSPGDPAQGG
jgi:hypothetical protein